MGQDNIILIGFMGTGKSTVGRLLAERLGWMFTDTDKRIEAEQGVSIAKIFELKGEAGFRAIESDTLRRVLTRSGQVIATGGGIVLAEANRRMMLEGGFVAALAADRRTIVSRVSGNADRPLLAGDAEARVERLLKEREGAYDFAHLTIDTTGRTPDEVARMIAEYKGEGLADGRYRKTDSEA